MIFQINRLALIKSIKDCKLYFIIYTAYFFYENHEELLMKPKKKSTGFFGSREVFKFSNKFKPYENVENYIPMNKWIPNEYARRWMDCKRNFDFFVRKHHCRRCGYLLCFGCWDNWVRIKDLFTSIMTNEEKKILQLKYRHFKRLSKKKEKVRICNNCYDDFKNSEIHI